MQAPAEQPMASSLVNNKYRITRRIGGGSFGEIYMGIGLNNEKVAVKFERHGARCPQLRHEYKVYRGTFVCSFCPHDSCALLPLPRAVFPHLTPHPPRPNHSPNRAD